MVRRVAAILILLLGTYIVAMGVTVTAAVLRSIFQGPWLGFEPEILIGIALLMVGGLVLWIGGRVWRTAEHPYSSPNP